MKRLLVLMLAMTVLMFVPVGTAHGGNHGTIKVHDEADADPDMRNEPHVDCEFFVEGFNMDGSAGELVFYAWSPTGNKSEVMRAEWAGTPEADEDGFHFLAGPFTLASGHYRVEAFSTEGHPGDHGHFAKAKMFWVECDEQPDECPPISMMATANEDGSIDVSWNTTEPVNLYRAAGSGDFEYIDTISGGSYHDTNTTVGTTYTYAVTVNQEQGESAFCARVEVTAIPVFPTALAASMAIGLTGLAYVVARRR